MTSLSLTSHRFFSSGIHPSSLWARSIGKTDGLVETRVQEEPALIWNHKVIYGDPQLSSSLRNISRLTTDLKEPLFGYSNLHQKSNLSTPSMSDRIMFNNIRGFVLILSYRLGLRQNFTLLSPSQCTPLQPSGSLPPLLRCCRSPERRPCWGRRGYREFSVFRKKKLFSVRLLTLHQSFQPDTCFTFF